MSKQVIEVVAEKLYRKATTAERLMTGCRSVHVGVKCYRVKVGMFDGCSSDALYISLTHKAEFPTEAEANKLADRVRAAAKKSLRGVLGVIDRKHWMGCENLY